MQLIQGSRKKCETRSVIDGDWGSSVLNAKGSWWLMVAFGLLPTGRGNPAGGHPNLANSSCLTRRVAPRDIYQRKGWWMLVLLGGGSAVYILVYLCFCQSVRYLGHTCCSELSTVWHSFKSMTRISCKWRQPRPIRTKSFGGHPVTWGFSHKKRRIYKEWLPDVLCCRITTIGSQNEIRI